MRKGLTALGCAVALWAADANPVLRVWRVNPQAATADSASLRAVLPDVHAVRVDGGFVQVESAGLALQSLSPLDVNAVESTQAPRSFQFRFPLEPRKAAAETKTPWGVIGAFVNGVPLYGAASAMSWRDQNIWHQDPVAAVQSMSPLVSSLLERTGRHSPLIGYARDGFPIYGPWGWDDGGGVRRFGSGYRLRRMTRRDRLPDGTALGPSQEGPVAGEQYPPGTFVEDYEYAAGTGDLDEHNGRFAKTPEYPQGTYAYFLSTDGRGRIMYPYLIGSSYFGEVPRPADLRGRPPEMGDAAIRLFAGDGLVAGSETPLVFAVQDAQGRRVRFLEKVHEKPIHLIVVSSDLQEFAHIHPELQDDDSFLVRHTFAAPGTYWLFADYTMPGKPQSIARFDLSVRGARQHGKADVADALRVTLEQPPPMRTGEDLRFRFAIADAASGQPVTDLEPYLGAWGHMMIVSQDGRHFIHAHPVDKGKADEDPWRHSHAAAGPGPSVIETVTGFETPGKYRMWVQVQRGGKVSAIPFALDVKPGSVRASEAIPAGAIRVKVSLAGFEPARIAVDAGKPLRIAFTRKDAENCASSVVFAESGIRKDLPAGRTTIVDLPAMNARELSFSCGMKMYRGSVVVR